MSRDCSRGGREAALVTLVYMLARASLALGLLLSSLAFAESTTCPSTPIYSRCELVFELNDAEAKAHPRPYESVELHAEFRSPQHHTTSVVHAFWDGGRRMLMRFAPNEIGDWEYRTTSNVERWSEKEYKFSVTAAEVSGFIRPANVHHWSYTENMKPHLWFGDTMLNIGAIPVDQFRREIDSRAQQKFTHVRGVLSGNPAQHPEYFRDMDERIAYMNGKGIVFDAVLTGVPPQDGRERYLRYIVSRYGSYNLTWEVAEKFDDLPNGREESKSIGSLLMRLDPYGHPRSAGAKVTSSPTLPDRWATHVNYGTTDEQIGAIEHQIYAVPFVSGGVASRSEDEFRHQLWNTSMNGQYPVCSMRPAESGAIKAWYDFFSDTRHWELEPYYDVDGGRAVALEGVEYVLYVEKPSGPVEVRVEKHGYDVAWFNPENGEFIRLKNWKGERFAAEPPDTKHDWVLYLSREGKKESMLTSWKFESRPILLQEVEQSVAKIPFVIDEPAKDDMSISAPQKYQVTVKKQTRGTRWMYYLWTGEVVTSGQGSRVLGTGPAGTFVIPPSFSVKFPAVLNVHLAAMNANGKVYALDRIYTLSK
jgi:hypothetical protein